MIFERIMLLLFQVALIFLLGIVGVAAWAAFSMGEIVPGIICTAFVAYVIKKTWLQ